MDLDDIAVQMRDWSGGTRGQVRVYANISAITQFLPSEIAAFLARYPEVDVHLQERVSPVIVKAVLENEADVGVCLLNAPAPGLEVFPYHEDELVLIAPRRHALAKQQVERRLRIQGLAGGGGVSRRCAGRRSRGCGGCGFRRRRWRRLRRGVLGQHGGGR